ncbi:MAG: aldehyde dehydrogenase family protein, partial [Chloroflexota bacterium]|nr:aldehyde dehydrogenase family protein [Chloroflexota bacterium]
MTTTSHIIKDSVDNLRQSVKRVIVGKDNVIDLALIAVLCRGHILAEDVPGIGKTTLARALSSAMDCTFGRLQFTPDLMPSDVLGLNWFNQKSNAFEFRAGPVFNQIVLADEINRATPRTQSSLLEAMQEGQVTIDGETRMLPSPFVVIATQNPIDMEGTFPLPEAQLDRFMIRLSLGYPSEEEEHDIVLRYQSGSNPPEQEAVIDSEGIISLQRFMPKIEVQDNGKLYSEMSLQTRYTPQWYHYFGGLADKIEGAVLPLDKSETFAFTRHEPLGVCVAILPWNSPLFLTGFKL